MQANQRKKGKRTYSTPDPWRINTQRPERKARPAGRKAAWARADQDAG